MFIRRVDRCAGPEQSRHVLRGIDETMQQSLPCGVFGIYIGADLIEQAQYAVLVQQPGVFLQQGGGGRQFPLQ